MKFEFDNRLIAELPQDPNTENSIRQVRGAVFSLVKPRVPTNPTLVAVSKPMAAELGISDADIDSSTFIETMSGKQLLDGMVPHATAYAGHQFGNWAGQLGDGRAINLGEINVSNEQSKEQTSHWILQLKGAGLTPYSRHADGLAVLRSSVREFICSEAMHFLGVPTTRALSLCLTGDQVKRDMFYDGNPKMEPGAVVCRVAPSFMRFGHLQLIYAQQNGELLKQLLDFIIKQEHPDLTSQLDTDSEQAYLNWFERVVNGTCELVIHWMRIGFVHGVMNTDNMATSCVTIDYGPYGFLDDFDVSFTPNTTDSEGRRYCYGRQPSIAHWNLGQLAQAISPLVSDTASLQSILDKFPTDYEQAWQTMMLAKCGLVDVDSDTDAQLLDDLMALLTSVEIDFCLFFRALAAVKEQAAKEQAINDKGSLALEVQLSLFESALYAEQLTEQQTQQLTEWVNVFIARSAQDKQSLAEQLALMNSQNPYFIPRNYQVQQAIDLADDGDYSGIEQLLKALETPYQENEATKPFAKKRPEWARHRAGCSMLSCSS